MERGTILIVDDNPQLRSIMADLLRPLGYQILCAASGPEALALAAATPPDLMLLDVMMPEFDGYEVCGRIRAKHEWDGTKIIMLTARGRDAERERGLKLGADAYVTKPFSTRELVDQVKRMLGEA
jgi:DNA-binding response OmpR family regulator